jgi:hypothetical protein
MVTAESGRVNTRSNVLSFATAAITARRSPNTQPTQSEVVGDVASFKCMQGEVDGLKNSVTDLQKSMREVRAFNEGVLDLFKDLVSIQEIMAKAMQLSQPDRQCDNESFLRSIPNSNVVTTLKRTLDCVNERSDHAKRS